MAAGPGLRANGVDLLGRRKTRGGQICPQLTSFDLQALRRPARDVSAKARGSQYATTKGV